MDDEVDLGEGELDEDDPDVPSDIPGDGGQISFPVRDLLEVFREHHRSKEGDIAARGGGLDDGFYNQGIFKIAAAVEALENGQEAPSEVEVPEMLIDADGRHVNVAPTRLPVMHQNRKLLQLGHCLPDINDHGMVIHVVRSRKNAPQNTPDRPKKFDKNPHCFTPDFDGNYRNKRAWVDGAGRMCKEEEASHFLWRNGGQYKKNKQKKQPEENKKEEQESPHKAWRYRVVPKDGEEPDFWIYISVEWKPDPNKRGSDGASEGGSSQVVKSVEWKPDPNKRGFDGASEGGSSQVVKRPKGVPDDRHIQEMMDDLIAKLAETLTGKATQNDEAGRKEGKEVRLTQNMLDTALCQTQTPCFAYASARSEAQGRGSHWKMHHTVLHLRVGAMMTLYHLLTLPVVIGRY